MKILYSLPHPSDRLGAQGAGHLVRASSLLDALQALGHEVVKIEAASSSSGGSVRLYRDWVRRLVPRQIAMILRDWGRIRFGKTFGGRLATAAIRHKPDVIIETHVAFSLAGKLASEHTGIPLVLDDVAPAWEEEREYGVGLRRMALSIHAQVTSQASLLVAVNHTLQGLLVQSGAAPDKVITIPNGIDPVFFAPAVDGARRRLQLQLPIDQPVIVFVGSFQAYHRVDLLLEAFCRIPVDLKAHLLLVGAGQTYDRARIQANALGLSTRVTFTGSVDHGEVASYIAAGDVAVMPATNDYGNPMKIYEYMALGKPVVAPRQPTIEEIATDGADSLLFEPGHAAALADSLSRIIDDAPLRARLGDAAKARAASQTWHDRALDMHRALERVVRSTHSM